jgi:C4-dicarboxylate-specific signal transduction histidine kinase
VEAGHRRLEVKTSPSPTGGAVLAVMDSGPGLAAADLTKVFSPFYTTKPDGMGMGLAICRSIVQDHGGQLTGLNHPEGGAVFTFTLPGV